MEVRAFIFCFQHIKCQTVTVAWYYFVYARRFNQCFTVHELASNKNLTRFLRFPTSVADIICRITYQKVAMLKQTEIMQF